jgi:hypothetical protein
VTLDNLHLALPLNLSARSGGMNRQLAKTIVDCLRFMGAADVEQLRGFAEKEWRGTLPWLDHSGLTLYLLRRLHNLKATDVLPPSILKRFGGNLAQNQRRLHHIANRFATINEMFYRAGVNFAVIKGFSLVPEFCPDPSLRTTSDVDYLVDKQSLPSARRVLEEAGYCVERVTDLEVQFRSASSRLPTRSDDPYSRETEALVELHLRLWDQKSTGVVLAEPAFRLDETVNHEWQGRRFPVLRKEEAFILQMIHVFRHVLDGWVKLCWLLEIGYFLSLQSSDDTFWDRVDVRMQEVPLLMQFGAIVMGLARTLFAPVMPPRVACWAQSLSAAARLWVERYGRTLVMENHPLDSFGSLPCTKFCIFLQWEFMPDRLVQREMTWRRLFPWESTPRVVSLDDKTAVGVLEAIRLQSQFVIRKLIFHIGSDLRFLWELPRWRQANRRARVISPGALSL